MAAQRIDEPRPTSTARVPEAIEAGGGEAKLKSCGTRVHRGLPDAGRRVVHAPARDGVRDLRLPARHDDRAELLGPVPRPALPDDRHDPQVGHRLLLRDAEADGRPTPRDRRGACGRGRSPAHVGRRPGRARRAGRALAAAAHDASSGSASGSTRACRSGSPTARSATSRSRCARTARRRCTTCCCTSGSTSRAAARRACAGSACCSRCSPSRPRGGPAASIWGSAKAAWFAAILMAFNPFLAQYAQEARMYSLVALLAIPATACFLRAYALDTDEPAAVDRGLRGLGRGRALHAQLADLLHRQRRASRGRCCGGWRPGRAAASCCATACSASAARSCSTCRGCRRRSTRPRTPGAPWADAPAFDSLLGVPGVLLGRMPQIVLLICAGAGPDRAPARRGRCSQHGRVAVALLISRRARRPTLAWTLSQASPAWANRYLAVALPPFLLLAAGGLALRAPARRSSGSCWW